MDVADDADNFARDNAVGGKTEREISAQRILVRKITFGERFADQHHGRRGGGIPFLEQTATKQRNSHHGEIARAGRDVISRVGCPRGQSGVSDNLKSEVDAAVYDRQWTGDSEVLDPRLGF